MKIKNKHKIIFTLLVFSMVFLIWGNVFAQSSTTSTTSIPIDSGSNSAASGLTKDLGQSGILNFLLFISFGLISLFSYLIDFSISIGKNVIALPIIQTGSQTMIGFANLGFVFAIIAIAFATIFRVQSYSMKQTLWKLIVAALLINFSLTIAGAFISVSNIFTDFFLQSLERKSLADGLMGVLNPQGLVKVGDTSFLSLVSLVNFFKYMASLFFVIVFNFIIILTFFALFIMLLIRVITLGVLLVVMPIVWLLWIFPGTQKYWSEWWSNFIRWTFFAPIVLFFIVLVVSSGKQLQEIRKISSFDQQQNVKIEKTFEGTMTLNPDFFDHITQIIITTGLLLGGLFAANKMGITFASTAMGWAQNSGKMFGGWAGRKGLQYGTGWLNKQRGGEGGDKKSYAQRLSDWSAGSKLAKYTILPGLAARGVAKLSTVGGEDIVKRAKKEAGNRSLNENIAMLSYAGAPVRQAILTHLQEKKLLGRVPNVLKYIDQKTQNEFAKNGQAGAFNDIEKSLGMNVEMKKLFDKDEPDSMKKFYEEGGKFFSKFSNDDWKKMQSNNIFSEKSSFGLTEEKHKELQEGIAHSAISSNPGNVVKILNNVTPENFSTTHSAIVKATLKIIGENPKSEIPGQVSDVLRKTMAKRLMGESLEFPGSASETKSESESKTENKV